MQIHGFTLIEERDIPELRIHARLFEHDKSGAQLLSLENQDENKVFGITFKTPPSNSTGVPHIIEHSVLCGSRKYPVKEPFVELVKGSLNTFLNAFTYPDKTCYPVASQNLQDFYNLIDVYLDAVFYPLISPFTLQQEGWHYELDSPDGPLAYKGVVFNEMKGNYSSPDNLVGRYSQLAVFPDNTYGVDSGGDPREITELTYEGFKRFYEQHYHPSNARIYFYGNDDPGERLRLMNEYLQEFERQPVEAEIAEQPRFDAPRRASYPFAAGEDGAGGKGYITLNWLLPESTDVQSALAWQILAHILIGTPASPLRKALIDSGLGEDLTGTGFENELRQMMFSTGLKGIDPAEAGKVEGLILDTLKDLVEHGIDPDMVSASLNTIEFNLRENNTGSFPQGLLLMLRALTSWLYGGDPLAPLAFEAPLKEIQRRVSEGEPFFENMIRAHLLDNPHRATVQLNPEPGFQARQEAEEAQRLEAARKRMSQDDLIAAVESSRELKRRQETPDSPAALSTIPSLALEDLDKQVKTIPIEGLQLGGTLALYHDLFTNGILYLDLGFDLRQLPQQYLPYTTLFARALLEIGTQTQDFVKLSQRIGRETGGIHHSVFTSAVKESGSPQTWLFLRGKSTAAQTGELLSILKDVLLTVKLDNRERFKQMVLEEKADQESMLVPAGHRVVNTRLKALFEPASWASEQISGVSYLFFLRQLAAQVDQDWPAVLAVLEEIRSRLLNRSAMLANVTFDGENWAAFKPRLEAFLAVLPVAQPRPATWDPQYGSPHEGLTIPAQVNYVGKGANLYDLGYQLNGSVSVINKTLGTTWLWERVRVQGGAYGGFSSFDPRSGVYTFLSYRDPNLLGTLQNYDGTASFLKNLDLSKEELTKSIIGTIGDLDAYQLPDSKGYTSMVRYLLGEDDAYRQRLRDQVLSTTLADYHAFGEVLARLNEAGKVVVLGSQDAIQRADQERGGWLDITRVL